MTASKAQPPPPRTGTLRLGLCCQFAREPIKFRTTTVTAMLRLTKREPASLEALRRNIERLPKPVRSRLTLENDDKVFSPADFPREWWGWPLTVEVEAKAKELAVARLLRDLQSID